mgnify:CR=1 FL=1
MFSSSLYNNYSVHVCTVSNNSAGDDVSGQEVATQDLFVYLSQQQSDLRCENNEGEGPRGQPANEIATFADDVEPMSDSDSIATDDLFVEVSREEPNSEQQMNIDTQDLFVYITDEEDQMAATTTNINIEREFYLIFLFVHLFEMNCD